MYNTQNPRTRGIDIIVPVYNALEDLKLCVQSILRHTDLSLDRLLLVDDKSPDPQVGEYLSQVDHPGIVILRNQENLGFSGTVNRGMSYSDRDVILLNADTVVTAHWVDKIVACAYSDGAIGTVTPFSNNATLCSVPNFCQENTIPYGLSIDEYAGIIERASLRKYPRITVAVGFCMFIKREVIALTGLFDRETFQRGYGEENDFCWRAEQLGYHHVLCDDTYIYHSGTASFLSEEKRRLIEAHDRILQDRYPRQMQENAEYVRDNPHQYLRTNVDLHARLRNGKKNLFYLLHTDFRPDALNNIGGTQFHVKDLVSRLRGDYNVFVMARDDRVFRLTIYLEEEQISFKFPIGKQAVFQRFACQKIANILRQVLVGFRIDMVHVHHVSDLSLDIFHIAHELGIPLMVTLHDYFYICPTVKLLENGSTYCAGTGKDCAACLHSQVGCAVQADYLANWRKVCREVLELCDVLFAPSQAAKDVYAGVYPQLAERIRVIPHGMDVFTTVPGEFTRETTPGFTCRVEKAFQEDYTVTGWAIQEGRDSSQCELSALIEDQEGTRGEYRTLSVSRPDVSQEKGSNLYINCGFQIVVPDSFFATGPLKLQLILRRGQEEFRSEIITLKGYEKRRKRSRRVAFLGGMSEAKGSRMAYQMIRQGGNKYEWYIVGGLGDPNLITMSARNLRRTGWYKREDVNSILRQNEIDLVCILPIWPETFCYTVSEAQLAGVPILATDIGALGERLSREQTGWLIDPGATTEQVLEKLDEIFSDEEALARVKAHTAAFTHRSIDGMCEEYAALYAQLPPARENREPFDAQLLYNGYVLGQGDSAGDGTDMDLIRQINELEATLQTINDSLEYKMVKFFNRERFPFKRQIKWLIGVAYRIYVKIRYKR